MKTAFLLTGVHNGAKRIAMGLVFALAATFLHLNAIAIDVDLKTANDFAVLAASTITAATPSTVNGGNVGLQPGTSITGTIGITPPYTTYVADGVALQAQNHLTTAYNQAAGFAPTSDLTGQDLGGKTLTPGVYFFSSSAFLTGKLTLNNQGISDAVFIFQIGSTLVTASDSSVVTINDGPLETSHPGISVFWQVGSSATLGTGTDFEGNILAYTSITDSGGSTVEGRLLARGAGGVGGAVTLNNTTITAPPAEVQPGAAGVPDTGSTLLLLGSGLMTLFAFKRRFFSPA